MRSHSLITHIHASIHFILLKQNKQKLNDVSVYNKNEKDLNTKTKK